MFIIKLLLLLLLFLLLLSLLLQVVQRARPLTTCTVCIECWVGYVHLIHSWSCHLDCVFKILSTKQQYETYLQQTSRIARCACFVREILEYRFLGSSRLRYGGLCRLRCSMLVTLHCERIFTWVHDTCRGKVIISTKFANSCKQSSKSISHTREVWKMYSDYLISLNVLLLK